MHDYRHSLVGGALLMEPSSAVPIINGYCPRDDCFDDLSHNENARISFSPRSIGSRANGGKDVPERRKSRR